MLFLCPFLKHPTLSTETRQNNVLRLHIPITAQPHYSMNRPRAGYLHRRAGRKKHNTTQHTPICSYSLSILKTVVPPPIPPFCMQGWRAFHVPAYHPHAQAVRFTPHEGGPHHPK
ncbi:unnamed protein product [Ectocarpus sp. 4 AP-2014]